jgi:hypothetical protein
MKLKINWYKAKKMIVLILSIFWKAELKKLLMRELKSRLNYEQVRIHFYLIFQWIIWNFKFIN